MKRLRLLAYGLFSGFDHLIWVLVKVIPGPRLIALVRRRPWIRLQLVLPAPCQRRWQGRIRWLLAVRCHRAGWASSCLCRSLAGRILLDLIAAPNALHLGMGQFDDGRKVPHAWLSDPATGRLFTPGLTPGFGAQLASF